MKKFSEFNIYLNRLLGDFLPVVPLFGVLLYENSLTLSNLSVIFLILSVSVILFEIPTGLIADRISAKMAMLFSRLIKLLAFSVIFFYPTFVGAAIGVFVWGIASAFDSGAFQSYFYQYSRANMLQNNFEKLYARAATASMCGLLLGAAVATQIDVIGMAGLQVIGLVSLILCVISTFFFPNVSRLPSKVLDNDNQTELLNPTIWQYVLHRPLLVTLLCIGILAGGIKGSLDEFVSVMLLDKGVVFLYIGYVLFGLELIKSGGAFFSQWFKVTIFNQWLILLTLGGCFVGIGWGNITLVIILLVIVLLFDAILWVHNDAAIQHSANDGNRATIASIKNFATELISASVLITIWLTGEHLSTSLVFLWGGILLIVASITLFVYGTLNKQ
jgi:MFS family permease